VSSELSDRELRVLEELSHPKPVTQRELSERVGTSLGSVNLVLKRLVAKGYVKVRGLNRRRLQYILTPRGFAEKARKSYRYYLRTVDTLTEMKARIQAFIRHARTQGISRFFILGEGERADVVELALRAMREEGISFQRVVNTSHISSSDSLVLITDDRTAPADVRSAYVLRVIAWQGASDGVSWIRSTPGTRTRPNARDVQVLTP